MDASFASSSEHRHCGTRCRRGGARPINLGSHKSAEVRKAIRAAGARLWYLPPYSPDLNPIEQAFAKIKHWMRQAQQRTVDETWRQIGHLAQAIKPDECSNYFSNAGYDSAKI